MNRYGALDGHRSADGFKGIVAFVYRLAERGQLPCVRIPTEGKGKRKKTVVRFLESDIKEFIQKHYNGAENE